MKMNEGELIDLSLLYLIKEKDLDYLSTPGLLESELLLKLGLNREVLREFPEELYNFCGFGLLHWQYPNQFSKYLVCLSKFKIESYLEIGVRHGGTFVITVEYLNRFNSIRYAIGIDINDCPSLNKYKIENPNIVFKKVDSQSTEFNELIKDKNFDLVLIDGSHDEADVRNDFYTVKDKANIVVFHDITNDACPDVGIVWNSVKTAHCNEYSFIEFTDQYNSVFERTRRKYLGIGLAIRLEYLKKTVASSVN